MFTNLFGTHVAKSHFHHKIKFRVDENHIMWPLQLLIIICGVLLWSKSCMFYWPFLWNIPKINFCKFFAIIHIKIVQQLWITSHNILSISVQRVECLPAICNICGKIWFSNKKWNLELIETLSCYHLNYSSWCVDYVCHQKFNLWSAFFADLISGVFLWLKVEFYISHFWEISKNLTFWHLFATIHM